MPLIIEQSTLASIPVWRASLPSFREATALVLRLVFVALHTHPKTKHNDHDTLPLTPPPNTSKSCDAVVYAVQKDSTHPYLRWSFNPTLQG